ncbi:MAG: HAD family phosphatase [Endomicrobia bacterium]|nr:HAD family phosphatase [Endomicrobiia bacterium]MCX7940582.1 HAD family phosphatase [Endomicrobiia bacterium]MDW8056276.1 HAD family phosphatase [Elusimicrobiota bacterium]
MKFNINDYKFIFFDFDGVIADTEWQHYECLNEVLKPYSIKISKQEYLEKYLAYDDKGCFKKVFKDKLSKELTYKEVVGLIRKKTNLLMSKLKQNFRFYKDAIEFINYLKHNFPQVGLCIVSGALKKEIIFILKKLKIFSSFVCIVSAEDVKNGKPSAEPFLVAKKFCEQKFKNKVSNNKILVIEDSVNGIISAKKASFKVLAVAHTYPLSKLKQANPDFIVRSLDELINNN